MIDKSNTDITKMEDVLRERLGKIEFNRGNINNLRSEIQEIKDKSDKAFTGMKNLEMTRAHLMATTLEHRDKHAYLHDLAQRARSVPMEAAERLSDKIRNTSSKINI